MPLPHTPRPYSYDIMEFGAAMDVDIKLPYNTLEHARPAIQVIQLVEMEGPPPRRALPPASSSASSSSPSSSSAPSSDEECDEDGEGDEEYCSSDDADDEGIKKDDYDDAYSPLESSTETYARRMKRILAWREDFSASLQVEVYPPTATRKRSAPNDDATPSRASKRSRHTPSPAPSASVPPSASPSTRVSATPSICISSLSPPHNDTTPPTSLAPSGSTPALPVSGPTLAAPTPTLSRHASLPSRFLALPTSSTLSRHTSVGSHQSPRTMEYTHTCSACEARFSSRRAFRAHANLDTDGACGAAVAYAFEPVGAR
ncbi:hypothetical protein C8J57DRAFT_461107 [Mycena rebaudengoi]|nr:hypothetical protein C8J57DRAFT_461107 [Mycena rebaudengoi]